MSRSKIALYVHICCVIRLNTQLHPLGAFAFTPRCRRYSNSWSSVVATGSPRFSRRRLAITPNGSGRLYQQVPSLRMIVSTREMNEELKGDFNEDSDDEDDIESLDESDNNSDTETDLQIMQQGKTIGFFIVNTFFTPHQGFDLTGFDDTQIERLELSAQNVTLPVAIMAMDPGAYPSFSKARKECRKGAILIHRGPSSESTEDTPRLFDVENCFIGRVGDRVFAGDILARQIRMSTGAYAPMTYKQPFEMDVVYEDDHFAIVNKPAGVVVYANRGGGHGRMTIRAVLPFILSPPTAGVMSVLRLPQPVHRLDKPTQGLLLIAKTKPALISLTTQFVLRTIKKTYTAIINGIPPEPINTSISAKKAHELGVDIDPNSDVKWQLIDEPLDEKSAVTVWRALRYAKCLKAVDQTLTLVELKPKTGRYHQLRRHMAWVCERPLAGDKGYDGGGDAISLRSRGLFLCSNRVTLEHPFYNTAVGRECWNMQSVEAKRERVFLYEEPCGNVMVKAEIALPSKFENFLNHEEERAMKLGDDE